MADVGDRLGDEDSGADKAVGLLAIGVAGALAVDKAIGWLVSGALGGVVFGAGIAVGPTGVGSVAKPTGVRVYGGSYRPLRAITHPDHSGSMERMAGGTAKIGLTAS